MPRAHACALALILLLALGGAPGEAVAEAGASRADVRAFEISLSFELEELGQRMGLADGTLSDVPVSLSGELLVGEQTYVLQDFRGRAGNSGLTGQLRVDLRGERPLITAEIDSDVLDLAQLLPARGPPEGAKRAKRERLIPDAPLPVEALRALAMDFTLDLEVKEMRWAGASFRNLEASLKLQNGRLLVHRLATDAFDGKLNAVVSVNARSEPAELRLDLSLKGFEPGRLPLFIRSGKPTVTGAVSDAEVKVNGAGNDVRTLMGNLNGHARVRSGEGQILNNVTDLIGASLLYTLAQTLNPFASKDKFTELDCAVANFDIINGIAHAEKGIALQTKKVNVIASGLVNLQTEKIDFGAKPVARQGLGINVGTFADFIRVGGTLADPKAVTDPGAVLGKAGSAGAAIFTGGVSLLAQGLYSRLATDKTPCETALKPPGERTGGAAKAAKGAAKGAGGAVGKAAKGAAGAVKGAGKAATDAVKRLFGAEPGDSSD